MALSKDQIARYSRQLILPELGVGGQQRLLASSALVIGAGGLGCPAALYLAAAGVGRISVVDADAVALSNLHRQVLHRTDGIGRAKSQSAQAALEALNPDVTVEAIHGRLTADNAAELVAAHDLVLDGSDNFPTRYLASDACVLAGKPLIHGGVVRLEGQVMTVLPRRSACYRCVFPEPPGRADVPSCQEAGVLGAVAGIIGTLMAQEALKVLAGIGEPLADRLAVFDGRTSRWREVPVRRDASCAVCGERATIRELRMELDACGLADGR
jgi:adenylyltransferase/sulfurtransferase